MVPRESNAVLYSQGLYSAAELGMARALKVAFDNESKKDSNTAQSIAVRIVKCANKEAFKGFTLRDQPKMPR